MAIDVIRVSFVRDYYRAQKRQHASNLAAWQEPGGLLVATEPSKVKRDRVRQRLQAAIETLEKADEYICDAAGIAEVDPMSGAGADYIRARTAEVRDLDAARKHALWPFAVAFLGGHFSADVKRRIRDALARQDPDWPAAYHMHWGMGVRNALREHGFGEEPFGIGNLDNIYVALIEESVKA